MGLSEVIAASTLYLWTWVLIFKARCQLFRAGLALVLGWNFTHCFRSCTSIVTFGTRDKKLFIDPRKFMEKYFQVYKYTLGKFSLNFESTDNEANLLLRTSRCTYCNNQQLVSRLGNICRVIVSGSMVVFEKKKRVVEIQKPEQWVKISAPGWR